MKITSKNCLEVTNANMLDGDIETKSKAWSTVYNFCCENGMKPSGKTGIESVIAFIERKLKPKSIK